MADLRIPSAGLPLAPDRRAEPAVRSEAVKAAQRAFFNAALDQTPVSTPTRAAKPSVAAAVTASPAAARFTPLAEPPARILRPGSLLDIKA